ncbi:Crp/Fnr family transcriptional regulator [Citrobacter portucalensis]|uniref:Crp/Fnr family transcriptional regulator n=1 Tax=Citrobacter portucalensis TaxID=1639133 RepID=UPI003CE6CB20
MMTELEHLFLTKFGKTFSVKKGISLLSQGDSQHKLYYLHEGIIRAVHHSPDGLERVKEFYFPGEYSFLYLPWLTGIPADYTLQMTTDGRVTEMPVNILSSSPLHEFSYALLKQQLIYKEKKYRCFF